MAKIIKIYAQDVSLILFQVTSGTSRTSIMTHSTHLWGTQEDVGTKLIVTVNKQRKVVL